MPQKKNKDLKQALKVELFQYINDHMDEGNKRIAKVMGTKVIESVLEHAIDWIFKEREILSIEIGDTIPKENDSEFMDDLKKI